MNETLTPETVPRELDYHQAAEWDNHEGTWLQWPHDQIYAGYQLKLKRIWLAMS